MANLRGLFRREISKAEKIKIFSENGGEDLGVLLDISQNGFRLSSKKAYQPGARLSGLIESPSESGPPNFVPFTAQCVWTHRKEAGFNIKEIPHTAEAAFDQLIERFAGSGG